MAYKKYQHLEKLGTVETEGILDGVCFIFPKLDGTNAVLWWDGELKAGSRNRELTIDKDNAGFYNWVLKEQNAERFAGFFSKYPNLILYGEWLVQHTLKTYRESAWKKLYVFDVVSDNKHLSYEEYAPILQEFGIEYIPPIAKVANASEEFILKFLEKSNYLIDEGNGNGEGIVIKNYEFVNRFGRTTWAKVVRQEFREQNSKVFGPNEVKDKVKVETLIAEKFINATLVEKEYAKLALDGWNSKQIPRLLNTIYYCLIKEDMWEIVKEFKNPTIEFKILQIEVFRRVKFLKPELF